MYTIACLLLCLDFAGPSTHALLLAENDDQRFQTWMSQYPLYKNTSEVTDFLKWLAQDEQLRESDSAVMPNAAFLSIVFKDNPKKVGKWVKSTQFSGNARRVVERALWFSGHAHLIKETFGKSPRYARKSPPDLSKLKLKDAGDLDLMWGAFMASGDVTYPEKVIEVLNEEHPLSTDKELDTVTRGAAAWSLSSFYRTHEVVHRLVNKRAGEATGSVKRSLDEIIERHEKSAVPLPNHDGQFCAMMAVMIENDMQEFDKAPDEHLRIQSVSKAQRGDTVAVKFLFSGMQLTADLRAHVVYDLKITGPSGVLYEDTDLKNQEAVRRKLLTRFRFYNNDSTVMIRFEPDDELGRYEFTAELKDLIGNKRIPLKAELQLTK